MVETNDLSQEQRQQRSSDTIKDTHLYVQESDEDCSTNSNNEIETSSMHDQVQIIDCTIKEIRRHSVLSISSNLPVGVDTGYDCDESTSSWKTYDTNQNRGLQQELREIDEAFLRSNSRRFCSFRTGGRRSTGTSPEDAHESRENLDDEGDGAIQETLDTTVIVDDGDQSIPSVTCKDLSYLDGSRNRCVVSVRTATPIHFTKVSERNIVGGEKVKGRRRFLLLAMSISCLSITILLTVIVVGIAAPGTNSQSNTNAVSTNPEWTDQSGKNNSFVDGEIPPYNLSSANNTLPSNWTTTSRPSVLNDTQNHPPIVPTFVVTNTPTVRDDDIDIDDVDDGMEDGIDTISKNEATISSGKGQHHHEGRQGEKISKNEKTVPSDKGQHHRERRHGRTHRRLKV